jgi:hypothetical protein
VGQTLVISILLGLGACDHGIPGRRDQVPNDPGSGDTAEDLGAHSDSGARSDLGPWLSSDLSAASGDLGANGDLATAADLSTAPDLAQPSIISGGPCSSGARGATAFRIAWIDSGGQATVRYEVNGLPDRTRWHAGAYGYTIGFTPAFGDPFLGAGGLQLDGSDFVDVELSTANLSHITSATLAIEGRSYNVDTDGSFNWQTFTDVGATPTDFVSNIAPYRWYAADATSAFAPGDSGVLLRIKAGPSSESLVVQRIELCMEAD